MHWFEGSIPSAIIEAKTKKNVFVIYITGDDDQSREMDFIWDGEEVSQLAQQAPFVAMKLESKSQECAQFSQIYPVDCVPSTYFIGVDGAPLEIVPGLCKVEQFVQKINKVLEMHKSKTDSGDQQPKELPSSSSNSSSSTISSEDEGAVGGAPITDEKKVPLAARVEQAKEKIQKKKIQKEEQEKKEAIRHEMDRRQVGQAMRKAQEQRQEEAARQAAQEIRQQRLEQKAARQRVKEQIEQDRAERAARFQQEKTERQQDLDSALQAKHMKIEQQKAQQEKQKEDVSKIQFRLPDGSSITHTFPAETPLSQARQFLQEHIGNEFGQFTLTMMYPRKRLAEDYQTLALSLRELEMTPSAILLVLPGSAKGPTGSGDSGTGERLLWLVLTPFLYLWKLLSYFLFAKPPAPAPVQPPPAQASQPVAATQASGASSQQDDSVSDTRSVRPKSSYMRRRPPGSTESVSRREGNIHRFNTAQEDDDDDSNTWNGNSTQQM